MFGYKTTRYLLILITACSLLASACLLIATILLPIPNEPSSSVSRSDDRSATLRSESVSSTSIVTLDAFSEVMHKRLHGPLIDPPPKPSPPEVTNSPPAPPVKPKIEIRLVGTLVEANQQENIAWLQIGSNPIQLVRTGETLSIPPSSIEVIRIEDKSLLLSIDDSESQFKLEENASLFPEWIDRND